MALAPRQAGREAARQRLETFEMRQTLARGTLGLFDPQAPHRLAFHKVGAQRRALAFGRAREKRIAVC